MIRWDISRTEADTGFGKGAWRKVSFGTMNWKGLKLPALSGMSG
jgi:hypothetical protein